MMVWFEQFSRHLVAAGCLATGFVLTGGADLRAASGRQDANIEIQDVGLTTRPNAAVEPGAEIATVTPGGPAAAAGICPGDVIIRIGNQPVNTPNDVLADIAVDRESGRTADTLLVRRDGRVYYSVVFLKAR